MRLILTMTAVCVSFFTASLSAKICGKWDVAPAYVHVDVLQHEKTIHRMDLGGIKTDATVVVWKGLCFKPQLLVVGNRGGLVSTGLGIGHCTPIYKWCMVTPSVGVIYTNLHTKLNLPIEVAEGVHVVIPHVKERFWSVSPYVGLDVCFTLPCDWRIVGQVQFSWSRTRTTLSKSGPLGFTNKDTSKSQGPSYGVLIEHDFTKCFSVNVGAAYNTSLTKEKHGLRGYGGKIGFAYWF